MNATNPALDRHARAVAFFAEHARYCYDQKTHAQALALAEQHAARNGWWVDWIPEECPDGSWLDDGTTLDDHVVECAILYAPPAEPDDDEIRPYSPPRPEVIASLGNIFDADGDYRRVVAAELALEAMGREVAP